MQEGGVIAPPPYACPLAGVSGQLHIIAALPSAEKNLSIY